MASIGKLLMISGLMAGMASCGSDSFKVKGEIEGADKQSVVLEKADWSGEWQAVDSTRTSGSGKYSMTFAAPTAPEVFRLRFGDQFVYFPVDSTETVTVNSTAKSFGHDFTLSGSEQALDLMAFEKEAIHLGSADVDSLARFKRKVFDLYIRDKQGGLISYYVLTKIVDGKPIYDPQNDDDVRYYSAVATAFKQYKPDDPRTALLEEVALQAMRRRNSALGKKAVIEAQELKVIDISLPATDGKVKSLSELVGQGRPVVLAFTALGLENAPAENIALNQLKNSRGVDVYMVCLDADQYSWREAAKNLPWTVVYAAEGVNAKCLRDYNVGSLPTYFIYNSAGELTDRVASASELGKKL